MLQTMVDVELDADLSTLSTGIVRVSQDLGTQVFPAGRAIPATHGIVGPRLFSLQRMGRTPSAGDLLRAARIGTVLQHRLMFRERRF